MTEFAPKLSDYGPVINYMNFISAQAGLPVGRTRHEESFRGNHGHVVEYKTVGNQGFIILTHHTYVESALNIESLISFVEQTAKGEFKNTGLTAKVRFRDGSPSEHMTIFRDGTTHSRHAMYDGHYSDTLPLMLDRILN